MSYNYLEKLLRPYMKGFNDTENIIADHFIKLGNEVVNKTLSNLADDTGLSEATIFKFVKKIGFDGFPNFKISVASNFRTMEERKNELAVFSDISKEDSSYTIAQKLVYSNKLALDNLGESLDEKKINQALDLMYDSKTLHFFGQGASSVIALDSYHKFLRTGVYCNYISDYHMQLSYATKLGPNDCVFLFSHSGETIETIEVAKILCANHVKIIVLTGNHYTDLVKLSTVAFIVDSEESVFQSETLTSRILYMTIIDILYVALMYHDEAKNKESLEKIRKALVITKKKKAIAMTIKAIVCDMDGTLLTSDHTIAPKTFSKLMELQTKGVQLILASGRSYIRLLPDALKLQMDKNAGLMIDVNGTSIYHVETAKRDRIGLLEGSFITELNQFFSLFTVELQYSQDDTIFTYLPDEIYTIKQNIRGEMRLPDDYPWMGGMYGWLCDTRDGYPNQHMIRSLANTPTSCNKISVVQEPAYMSFVRDTLKNHPIYEQYEYVFSDERKMEITNKAITKGNALDRIMAKQNIQHDEMVVFGDSENDISMFKNKKYSVAMGNALASAKQQANYTTDSHNHEGVYHMLVRLEDQGLFE